MPCGLHQGCSKNLLQTTFKEAEFTTEESKQSQKKTIICNHICVSQWGNCTGGLGYGTCAGDWVANGGLR